MTSPSGNADDAEILPRACHSHYIHRLFLQASYSPSHRIFPRPPPTPFTLVPSCLSSKPYFLPNALLHDRHLPHGSCAAVARPQITPKPSIDSSTPQCFIGRSLMSASSYACSSSRLLVSATRDLDRVLQHDQPKTTHSSWCVNSLVRPSARSCVLVRSCTPSLDYPWTC